MTPVQLQTNAIPVTNIAVGDTPYSASIGDEVIVVDTDGGDVTVNLHAGMNGNHKKIINTGTSALTAILVPNGTEQIRSGGAGVPFNVEDWLSLDVQFDPSGGGNWL